MDFDVIVIGSGIGGLAAASLLARHGRKVCLVERHSALGGYAGTFRRRHWEWDVGLHYVGEMAPGRLPRRLMDAVTGGGVNWLKLPDPLERLHYPGQIVSLPVGAACCRDHLVAMFPAERAALDDWFADLRRVRRNAVVRTLFPSLASRLRALRQPSPTLGGELQRRFRDPRLRSILSATWGDWGVPPGHASFTMAALVLAHFLDGGWYPAGGAGRIATAARMVVEAHGGVVLLRTEAQRVLVRNRRAVGVEVIQRRHDGEMRPLDLRAPVVISDAGAVNTYARLLPPEYGKDCAAALGRHGPALVPVQFFLGLDGVVAGADGANHWLFDAWDHDSAPDQGCFLTFPGLKAGDGRPQTASIVTMMPWSAFTPWAATSWRQRGEDYLAFKRCLAERALGRVERHFPGLRSLVAVCEVGTPLSSRHFTAHPCGEAYGIPATPDRDRAVGLGPRTPVKGVFLAGADAATPGMVGALFGGAMAAGLALGPLGFARIMAGMEAE